MESAAAVSRVGSGDVCGVLHRVERNGNGFPVSFRVRMPAMGCDVC